MQTKRIGEETVKKIAIKKNKVTIHFEKRKVILSENAFTEFRLYEGKSVPPTEMRQILDAESLDDLLNYAMRLLSHENYSEHDLREKLWAHGADLEQSRKIIFRFKKQGLLDDVLYAKSYAEDVADLRLLGKRRVLYDLHKHGIPSEITEEIEFPYDKEVAKARSYASILDRRYSRIPTMRKDVKAIQALLNRGFDERVAKEACGSLTPNDPKEERKRLETAYKAAKARYKKKYDGYELRRRIFAYLLSKGYRYEDIEALKEEKR